MSKQYFVAKSVDGKNVRVAGPYDTDKEAYDWIEYALARFGIDPKTYKILAVNPTKEEA